MPGIFISYRRRDTQGHAGRLSDKLREHFGSERVFQDLSGSIEPGEPFDKAIERAMGTSGAVLAMIGPQWLTAADDAGRRLDNADDYVRRELAMALQLNLRVIPVLVMGATMPRADALPADLQRIATHQAIELSDTRWDFDVSTLIRTLEKVLGVRKFPAWGKAVAASVLLIAGAFLVWRLGPFHEPQKPAVKAVEPGETKPKNAVVPDKPAQPPVGESASSAGESGNASSELVLVPDVVRMSLDEAGSTLTEARLRLGRTSFLTLGRFAPGIIYGQETRAGTRVRPETAIGVYVEREKRRGIHSSGQMYLSHAEILDLDQDDRSSREGSDIRFDGANSTERYLEPINGAALAAVGPAPMTRDGCAAAPFSSGHVRLAVGEQLCARTTAGRYALLKVDDLGRELRLSFNTLDASAPATANATDSRVRLGDGESYHFRAGVRGRLTGGDLYLKIAENGAAEFFANNRGQRGLVDLGDIGNVRLSDVRLPSGRFNQFGVPVVSGHTYVSLAREGEGSHFIVLRVDQVASEFVALTYAYR